MSQYFRKSGGGGCRAGWLLRAVAVAAMLSALFQANAQTNEAGRLTPADAGALIHLLREPDARPVPSLTVERRARLIVSFYHEGRCAALVSAEENTPAESARRAASMLNDALRAGNLLDAKDEGVISFDIVRNARDVELTANEAIGAGINLGVEGLEITSGGRSYHVPPLMALRHSSAPNFMESLFRELGTDAPAFLEGRIRARAFTTQAFAEKRPLAEAAEISMGTMPYQSIARQKALESLLRGSYWLMVSQEEDGGFRQRYDPLGARVVPGRDMAADLKIAETLLKMHAAIGDRDLRDAANKTIELAIKNLREMGGPAPASYVRLGTDDELPATVALLQTLAIRASVTGRIEDMDRLKRLGNFMLEMTDRQGGVHISLRDKAAGERAQFATGGVAEDTAMALIALYELSQDDNRREWLNGARRIIDGQVGALGPNDTPHPKLVIALGRFFVSADEERYATLCVDMGKRLADGFIPVEGDHPAAYAGGFRRDAGPSVHQTALALHAVATAFDVSRMIGRWLELDPGMIVDAASFIVSQQYDEYNGFYLSRSDVVEGSFRAGVRDAMASALITREAIEALIAAATIVPMD